MNKNTQTKCSPWYSSRRRPWQH